MQNNKLLSLFIMCCLGLYTQVSKAQVSESDSLELVNFYYATGGDNWSNNIGWLVSHVKFWEGITLTDDESAVKEIHFLSSAVGSNLVGEIPNLNLPNLEILNLNSNQLTGEIPNFNNLINLKHLVLYNNQLTGEIPNFNLPSLLDLWLNNNQLTGNIPNFSNLFNLRLLALHNKKLLHQC